MDAFLWVVGAVAAAPIAWFLLTVVIGVLLPAKVTGRRYLRKQLTQLGVDPERVPDACLDELVRTSELVARGRTHGRTSGEGFNTEFVRSLELDAHMVVEWLRNPNEPSFEVIPGEDSVYREIFVRHGVQ